MRTWTRVAAVSASALLVTAVAAAPAGAVGPPPNDDISNATPVSIGFSEVLDTTGQTVGPSEISLSDCDPNHRAEGGGVWYTVVGTGDPVVVDISGTDYDAFVFVGVGLQEDGSFADYLECDVRGAHFDTEPGTTYYILVADEDPEDGIGGSLHISFEAAPPLPTATLTLSRRAVVYRTGVPRLHGTYACTNAELFLVDGDLTQPGTGVGFMVADEPEFDGAVCDGARHRWSARTSRDSDPPAPRFRPGWARAQMAFQICGTFDCVFAGIDKWVFLEPRYRR